MREVVTLSVSSFRGSIGGEHYYGRLHVSMKMARTIRADGTTGYVMRMGHGVEQHEHDGHEVTRVLGAREAAYLNRKDGNDRGGGYRLKAGDSTTRFNDVASLIETAVAQFPTMFDDSDILLVDRARASDEFRVLVGPEEARTALAGLSSLIRREEWLMEHGYMVIPDADAPSDQ